MLDSNKESTADINDRLEELCESTKYSEGRQELQASGRLLRLAQSAGNCVAAWKAQSRYANGNSLEHA